MTDKPTNDRLGTTPSGDSEQDPLDTLATEFSERCRNGERVSIEAYAAKCPELAEEIRELFPTIQAMERLNVKRAMDAESVGGSIPSQLGDYRVIAEIARGGMGIVYEAEQISLGRKVAVKVLPRHALRRPRDVARFEREAQTAAKLHHSNIVPVFGVGEDDGHHYIVMQLIRGVGLDEVLAETKRLIAGTRTDGLVTTARTTTVQRSAVTLLESDLRHDSTQVMEAMDTVVSSDAVGSTASDKPSADGMTLDPLQVRAVVGPEYYRNVARIGLQAAQALRYAHSQDTLHRDLKPGNLLLDSEGRVWMADFGLAKAVESDSVTCSGDVVGTLAYVAPERFRGDTTPRSDIYSLGLTLHEMLTFRRAFDGNDRMTVMNQVAHDRLISPRKVNAQVPPDLETIVLKAASQDPSDRYQDAGQMADDLARFLEDRPIWARPLSRVEHAVRWCRRNRTSAALAGVVVFLLLSGFAATVAGYLHSVRERRVAEATSRVAVGVLDEIYHQFAAWDTNVPVVPSDEDGTEEGLSNGGSHLPLSKDVAFMLENLLHFYDDVPQRDKDSSMELALKYIASNAKVGDIQRRLGQYDQAQKSYEAAIERVKALDHRTRRLESVRLQTAQIHNGLGMVHQERGRGEDAVPAHQAAITLLSRKNATEAERFELARSLYLVYRAEFREFRWNPRRKANNDRLQRAIQLFSDLARADQENPIYSLFLARCLLAKKSGCVPDGELNDDQEQAIRTLESLVESAPENPEFQFELGEAYRTIERDECREQTNETRPEQLAKSERRLRRGLEVTATLDVKHPNIPKYNYLKKELHYLLARVLEHQHRLAEADQAYQRAIDNQQVFVQQSSNPRWSRYWLLRLQYRHAKMVRMKGETERSRRMFAENVAGYEVLLDDPVAAEDVHLSTRIKEMLGLVNNSLGHALEALGHTAEAEERFRRAEEVGVAGP